MIKIGDVVACQLYNTPDSSFYGEGWKSEVLEIDFQNYIGESLRPYLVQRPNGTTIWLSKKEIK